MITGTKVAAEISENASLNTASVTENVTDEIKRNHLQVMPIKSVNDDYRSTEFIVKFARLKKALRKRSSSIL